MVFLLLFPHFSGFMLVGGALWSLLEGGDAAVAASAATSAAYFCLVFS